MRERLAVRFSLEARYGFHFISLMKTEMTKIPSLTEVFDGVRDMGYEIVNGIKLGV